MRPPEGGKRERVGSVRAMCMAGTAVPDGFVTHPILLAIEGEGNESGGEDFLPGTCGVMIERARADPELDVPQNKMGVARRAQVFARA